MKTTRRDLLRFAALLPFAPVACHLPRPAAPRDEGVLLNDVHSALNASRVAELIPVRDAADMRRLVRRASREGKAISIAGGRHSMGGQQFGARTLHADTRPMAEVLDFDADGGRIRVAAGIQWPELIDWYLKEQNGNHSQWGIAQKQTGADQLSIGGAVSANAHGRGLTLPPLVAEVEEIELVDAGGELRSLSRRSEPELFRLVVGGYGLFGLIHAVTLQLVPRRKLERVVEVRAADRLEDAFDARIAAGFLYGDFQFSIDPASPDFLRRGVFSCYRPVADDRPMPEEQRRLQPADWTRLLYLAHIDKTEAFRQYAEYYRTTDGQLYWSDLHQLSYYDDGYHRVLDSQLKGSVPASEMISEVYVPMPRLSDFVATAAAALRNSGADVVYGTVRLIEPDEVTYLPWARERFACIVLNLHVRHDEAGIRAARGDFRHLIDLALERGGSYFLTYHRWARRDQVLAAYPQLPDFLRRKLHYDPNERFQSDWYRHYRTMFADLL